LIAVLKDRAGRWAPVDAGLLILRIVVGALFVGHGTQKLFGWFGGGGPEGTGMFYASIGFRPEVPLAMVAGVSEAGGGTLLSLGLVTPLAAAVIIGVMISASVAAHWKNGLWNTKGGYELPLVYATAAATVAFAGPGRYSLDHAIGWDVAGVWWGIGSIVLGAAAASVVLAWRAAQMRRAVSAERRGDRPAA
jgi:putative oxidoreductase